MRAKEYLKQIRVYQVKLEQMTEEIKRLQIVTAGIKASAGDSQMVSSSRLVEDKMAQGVANYVDMEIDFQKQRWEYMQHRQQIISEIHRLTDSRYIQILYLHYVECRRLEEIACIMTKSNGEPYSFDHINALHGEALNDFEKKILNPIETPKIY